MTCTPGYVGDPFSNFTNYDLTGMEKAHRFNLHSTSFMAAIGLDIPAFEDYSFTGDYYWPIPDDLGAFEAVSKTGDGLGNVTNSGVRHYWEQYILNNTGTAGVITGKRLLDKSRLKFKINSIKFNKYGVQPTDLNQNINLTGNCVVSGEFGYDSQAESAVFTEGVFLKEKNQQAPLANFYAPSYVSDVLLRLPLIESGSPTSPIDPAPSKCVTRTNVAHILRSGNSYTPHLTQSPYFYNRYIVPAMSDLSILNEGSQYVGFEQVLASDGAVFPNTVFALSASLAQHKGTPYEAFMDIPNAPKIYYVEDIRQFYDSSVTDSILNSGFFMGTGRGPRVTVEQNRDATGFAGPENARYSLFKLGLYEPSGYDDYSS